MTNDTNNTEQLLKTASAEIYAGNIEHASSILNALKAEQPLSPSVARLWCLLARRTGRSAEIPDYAAKIYAQVSGDVHKARWAHIMATANFITLNLEAAQANFACAIEHLIALIKTNKVPTQKKKVKSSKDGDSLFASGKAEQLLWQTCTQLANNGVQAFPFAGTLLGIVRGGKLLDFDKDLDVAVWVDSLEACRATLEQNGWNRVQMGINYSNYHDYVHAQTGITLDICGLERKNNRIEGGFCLPGYPDEYQRLSLFPDFELVQRETSAGRVWFPQQPKIILNAFYGDWHTPNPNWDTVVSALNLKKFTLLVRCYAYYRLTQQWLSGNLIKAWSYALQIGIKDPDDALVLRSRQWLEKTLTSLNQTIPDWPQNRPQKRIYTRMVADLFHQGHVNFLRAARALGTHLTVCVVTDERVLDNKGKRPVMTQEERVSVVSACKYVDDVITDSPVNATVEFMQQHDFDLYTFASASDTERAEKSQQCAALPPEMVQEIDYTSGISTSDLVGRVFLGAGKVGG